VAESPLAWWQHGQQRPARHTVLWAGELGDPHADAPDPGLLRITAEEVIGALDDHFAEQSELHHVG
jgi:hypothetical protein